MKSIILAFAVVLAASQAKAAEPLFIPTGGVFVPTEAPTPVPEPIPEPATPGAEQAMPAPQLVTLYGNVRVKSPRHKHPCAIPQVVAVPNPCRGQCEPVYVQICVPPCDPPCVTIGPRGKRITFSYPSGHRVQVTSLRGRVTIDYDR